MIIVPAEVKYSKTRKLWAILVCKVQHGVFFRRKADAIRYITDNGWSLCD